jgi:gas vesicle protein
MKRYTLFIVLVTTLILFSGCGIVNKVSQEAQQKVGEVQHTIEKTVQTTTETIQTGIQKIENVTNAINNLKKSIDDLKNWQINSNKNTNR